MKQTNNSSFNSTQVFLVLVLAIIVIFLILVKNNPSYDRSVSPASTSDTLTVPSDLDQTQDEINTVNVDSVDSGLNQINSESANL